MQWQVVDMGKTSGWLVWLTADRFCCVEAGGRRALFKGSSDHQKLLSHSLIDLRTWFQKHSNLILIKGQIDLGSQAPGCI